jgi:superfamily II DNA or RNA helicase
MTDIKSIPSVSVSYASNGSSTKANELGMRVMQERAYEKRGEQYLLIKSPPASGKSRALMFIALDKLNNQGIKKAIIVVPEKSIGASFNDEPLTQYGFYWDWQVVPKWNLCNAPGEDGGKVNSVKAFLESDDRILVCTHATIRFAVDKFGIQVFDDCLLAVDEFHHVSANPDNKLGIHLGSFIARDKIHIVAMTGSYFRGDAEAVLSPQDEAKFETVTYTYYEQLNGYEYLKTLDIGYYFYSGSYIDEITDVLDTHLKTIIHIPNVNSRESTQRGKTTEVSEILGAMGEWKGKDPVTGFDIVVTADGRTITIADLVDDGPERHSKVLTALKDPAQKNNRGHVDVIIALGMAKEGFDWIWCEHALTIGYRSSLTEIIQIIGRATRDAKGKTRSKFTNLIAEPDASEEKVTDAVNDTLKAIAASLLMEQVLTPKFNFTPKNPQAAPMEGFDYGENGYNPNGNNVGFNEETGQFHIEVKGLIEPKSKDAKRICQEDLNEVITAFVQDKTAIERGLFDDEMVPEELTQVKMGKIVRDKYPELDAEDQEAVRQHAIAALNMTQQAKKMMNEGIGDDGERAGSTAFIQGVRKYAMDVRDLDIDLIDHINPFSEAYAILAKAMNEESLKQVQAIISGKKVSMSIEEARELAKRALQFKKEHGRLPSLTSADPWEKKMAEGVAYLARMKAEAENG